MSPKKARRGNENIITSRTWRVTRMNKKHYDSLALEGEVDLPRRGGVGGVPPLGGDSRRGEYLVVVGGEPSR